MNYVHASACINNIQIPIRKSIIDEQVVFKRISKIELQGDCDIHKVTTYTILQSKPININPLIFSRFLSKEKAILNMKLSTICATNLELQVKFEKAIDSVKQYSGQQTTWCALTKHEAWGLLVLYR